MAGLVYVDGHKLLMVAIEMLMALFALLYAFPHIPTQLLGNDPEEEITWTPVNTHKELVEAVLGILKNSPVLRICARLNTQDVENLQADTVSDMARLDGLLGLFLMVDDIPVTCQQMYHCLCAAYRSILFPRLDFGDGAVTRDWVAHLLESNGLIGAASVGTARNRDQSGLLPFCSTRMVAWLQPYFASSPMFYYPERLLSACE